MNNYIYINGKKIEISEETADNLKKKFSEKSPYELEKGDYYYTIKEYGDVGKRLYENDSYDKEAIKQGNVFRTKEKVEHERDKREAIFKIKKYIYDNFGYDPTDWADFNDFDENKFNIYYNSEGNFDYWLKYYSKEYSPIGYLKTEEQAQEIIDNFEDELKIIFDI